MSPANLLGICFCDFPDLDFETGNGAIECSVIYTFFCDILKQKQQQKLLIAMEESSPKPDVVQSEGKSSDSDHVPDSDKCCGCACCADLFMLWIFIAFFYALLLPTYICTLAFSPQSEPVQYSSKYVEYIVIGFVITATVVACVLDSKDLLGSKKAEKAQKPYEQPGEQLEELPQQKQPPKQKQPGSGRMHWSAVYS